MSLTFRALGLGGGGIKGILHIGALQELAKHQPLVFPDGIYGSSIGSILATYLAFGLPLDKTPALISKYLSFDMILPNMDFKAVASAFSKKGMYTMDTFESNLVKFFEECDADLAGPDDDLVLPLISPVADDHDPRYEVDKILWHRTFKGRREMLLRWAGYDESHNQTSAPKRATRVRRIWCNL
jgi:hypothetical protein